MARPQILEQPRKEPTLWQRVLSYIVCYVIWLLFAAFGFWLLLSLRTNLFDLGVWLAFNPWQVRAIDRFAILILGLLWFIGILVLENYLRVGVERQSFWQRARFVALLLGAGALLSWGLQQWANFA